MADVSLEKLVGVFIKMRDKKDLLDAESKQLDSKMRQIKAAINDHLRESGLESVKTKAGLAYRTVKTTYSSVDWTAMHQFILEHELPDLLEKRIHQKNMQSYLEEHPDDPPPGLNTNMEYSVTVKGVKNG